MMPAKRFSTVCDLSEAGIEEACMMLGGVQACELHLFCAYENRIVARQLQGKFGFALSLVPAIILRCDDDIRTEPGPTPYTRVVSLEKYSRIDAWCVMHPSGIIWSPGA